MDHTVTKRDTETPCPVYQKSDFALTVIVENQNVASP